jgi:hypothetical protein
MIFIFLSLETIIKLGFKLQWTIEALAISFKTSTIWLAILISIYLYKLLVYLVSVFIISERGEPSQ